MSNWKTININDYVKVQLTDRGRNIHRRHWENLHEQMPSAFDKYTPPKEDMEGWSMWQAWELMRMFGPHLGNGVPVPFNTTIRVEVKGEQE